MKHLFLAIAAIATMLTSCNSQKVLILYYSQTGTTQVVAEELQNQLGADIERIDVAEAYDGDFMATVQRFNEERQSGFVPTLLPLKSNLDKYDTIFIGYPVWSGTYAPAIAALLNSANLDGKTVVSFCTFGSGGLNTSTADLVKALPNSTVKEGYGVRAARLHAVQAEVNRFLIENGYKEGSIEALPEYSEQVPVTEEDVEIFNAACSDYQFPLGTPVTVGKRSTAGSEDYLFTVSSGSPFGGAASTSSIYVTVADGGKPEFTVVVR